MDMIREPKGLEFFFQFVNIDIRGFCLGSNAIKSLQGSLIGRDQLFAEGKCNDNSKVQWIKESILVKDKQKCVQ